MRRGYKGTFVSMMLAPSVTRLWFYIDNTSAKPGTVQLGKLEVEVAPKSTLKKMVFLGECPEAKTVTTAAGSGELRGKGAASYVVDVTSKGCYLAKKVHYAASGARQPVTKVLRGAVVHHIDSPRIDYFLEAPPKELKVGTKQGRDVNNLSNVLRHSVERTRCR